jgi:uncharacterized protein with GYD domain
MMILPPVAGSSRRAKELEMAKYMLQISYTPESWAKQLKNPVNRLDLVKPVIEKVGAKVENAYYAFGEYDIMLIIDAPDNEAASALSLAFAAGGALAKCHTTVLMSVDDGVKAIRRAGELSGSYSPPA